MRLSLTEPNVTGNGHLSPVMFAWIPVSESQHNKQRVLALNNLLPYIMSVLGQPACSDGSTVFVG